MKLRPVELQQIKIKDSFWSKHVDLVADVIIPYQWDALNDRLPDADPSHCLENFAIAAGRKTGEFHGMVFQDTDVAKWLEAVGFSLAVNKNEALEKVADEVIELIGEAQQPDGYLNTYFTIKDPEQRWKNLCEGHELYTAGHMMEAAVAYYLGTGKRAFLNIVIRFADLLCRTFGVEEGQNHGYPGHQEVEIGLIKLYNVTGEKKYLDLAKHFIDIRGVGENYFLKEMKRPDFKRIFPHLTDFQSVYSQSDKPARELTVATGHAVRAVYMYSAMADLAYEYQDEELIQACKRLWNNIVQKQMYITGGIGSSGILERFTVDYDLPNDRNYSETCASIGLAMFGIRMANILRDAKYIDVVERALYNTVLAGIALDGKSFFYVNPLEVWPPNCITGTSLEHVQPNRRKWFGVACCPPNVARALASLGHYIYSTNENELFLNLFISNDTEVDLSSGKVSICVETKFPFENRIFVKLSEVPSLGLPLRVRIPEYAKEYTILQDGQPLDYTVKKGYAYLHLSHANPLEITFEAPPTFIRANPNLRANIGKVALVKGPLVYCLEEVDNGINLAALLVDTNQVIEEKRTSLFGGITELNFKGKRVADHLWSEEELYGEHPVKFIDVPLKGIPYPYWNNRGPGEMLVWMKELLAY
jgi:DUF1680 family protein